MRIEQETTNHSLLGREIIPKTMKRVKKAISASEVEILEAIKYMTQVHGPAGVGKFKESIGAILFRCVLHSDPIDENTEKAIQDLYQISYLIGKIEEYQLNSK